MGFDEVKYQIEEFFNGKFEVKKFLGERPFAKGYLVFRPRIFLGNPCFKLIRISDSGKFKKS